MSRIIIFFFVGQEKIRCRHVLHATDAAPNATEKLVDDALGAASWIPVDGVRGLPSSEQLVRRALRVVFGAPSKVTKTERGVEIELGEIR